MYYDLYIKNVNIYIKLFNKYGIFKKLKWGVINDVKQKFKIIIFVRRVTGKDNKFDYTSKSSDVVYII